MKMPKRHNFMFLFGVLWLLGPIASSILMDSELNYVPATSRSIDTGGDKILHKGPLSNNNGNLICPRSLYSDFFRGKSVPAIQNDVRNLPEPQRVSTSTQTEHLIDTEKTAADYFSAGTTATNEPLQNQQNLPDHRGETVLQLVPDQEVKELEDRPDDRYIVKATPKQHVQTEELHSGNKIVIEELSDSHSQEKENLLPPLEDIVPVDGNRTDDQVVEITSEAPNKTDRDIPSFREWSQKALEEEQKKREEDRRKKDVEREKKKQQNQHAKQLQEPGNVAIPQVNPQQRGVVSQTSTARQKKNFASPDCGAKVVAANPESQGAPNVLTSYRDEYLLNKCSDESWFVVELCESIKAHKVEIANFELYSSVPYEFKVSLGNSPHKDANWALFGLFQAKDERVQQEFSQKNGGVYGKYVKVNILSHHGNEHYCPISIFKIYGTPEIELIGEEEEDNDDDENDNAASDVLKSDDVSNDPSHMVFKFIKDKMGETLEKIVGVFKPKDQSAGLDMVEALNESSLVGSTYSYDIVCPMCSIEVKRDVYFLLATNYAKMSSALANRNIRTAILSSGFCQSNGIDISQKGVNLSTVSKNTNVSNSQYVGHQLVKFYTTLYGTSRLLALCNMIAIDQGLGKLALPLAVKSGQTPDTIPEKIIPTLVDGLTMDSKSEAPSVSQLNLPSSKSSSSVVSTVQQGVTKTSDSSVTLTSKSSLSSILSSSEPEDRKAQNVKEELVTDSSVTPEKPEPIVPTPVTPSTPVNLESMSTKAKEPEMREPPDVVLVPPVDVTHFHSDMHGEQINGNGNKNSGNGQQGRESVWQKLSNRIKALERNVSLSSGYLEELSVLYKKQIEDLQVSMRQVTESLALSTRQRERDQQQITQLQTNYSNLLGVVTELTIQMDTLRTWAFVAHVFLLIFEAMFGGLFLMACYRRLKRQQLDLLIPANASLTCVSSAVTQPILVHPNSKKTLSMKASSTPMKRRISVENIDFQDEEDKENRQIGQNRRLSLDELLNQEYSRHQKSNGSVKDINLSKKQRKRLLRRLSLGKDRRNHDLRILTHASSENNFEKDDDFGWTPVIRAGSMDRTTPPALETVPTFPNGHLANVPTSNVFGILNNSLHDDPTPTKERSVFYNISNNNEPYSSAKKLKFSPEVEDRMGSVMDPDDPNYLCAPKPHVHRSNTLKRSKSTSPTRSKTQVAKQRDIFKQFNPENVDWMKH